MVVLGFLIPAMFAIGVRNQRIKVIPYWVLGLALGVRLAFSASGAAYFVERATASTLIPANVVKLDGTGKYIANLGSGYFPADKLDQINRLGISLERYLRPGETYYDLTERSAFYYFLGYKVPAPYSADYLAANQSIQEKIIIRLTAEKPPVVWVGPAMQFDEASPSFRSYRIFRWLMEQGYRYETIDGNEFLVRPDRLLFPDRAEDLTALTKLFYRKDLKKLSIAWGRNFSRLENRFQTVQEFTKETRQEGFVAEKNGWIEFRSGIPAIEFTLTDWEQQKRPDYLMVTLRRRGPANSKLSAGVFWKDVGGEYSPNLNFTAKLEPQTLLIPLGSDPRWHRAKRPDSIKVEIRREIVGSKWKVESAKLLRLVH